MVTSPLHMCWYHIVPDTSYAPADVWMVPVACQPAQSRSGASHLQQRRRHTASCGVWTGNRNRDCSAWDARDGAETPTTRSAWVTYGNAGPLDVRQQAVR
jgi:hypothetical protein